jgi:uncharacterized membrane protein YoaK (UPF0700 family)
MPPTTKAREGQLPALLLTLTVVTGVVDAVSILDLGRVFVANMTGNVVFIAFAAVGAPGFLLSASVVALGAFVVGAALWGRVMRRRKLHGPGLLGFGTTTELVLVAIALAVALMVNRPLTSGTKDVMAGLLALAMGVQNATARRLAIPDLTTTVLTMALTGAAADSRLGAGPAARRRVLSVVAMFGGAVVGAALVIHGHLSAALAVAVGLLLGVALLALSLARKGEPNEIRATGKD